MVLLNAKVTMQILSILAIFVKPCTGIIVLIKYYIIISTEVFSIPLFEYVKKKQIKQVGQSCRCTKGKDKLD